MTAQVPSPTDDVNTLLAEIGQLRLRQAAHEREVAELQLEVRTRDGLLATAGRELRNAIGAVAVPVRHLVEKSAQDPSLPVWLGLRLQMLERHVRHFVRRATTLLDVAQLASGHPILERQRLDYGALAERVVGELEDEAQWARCRLEVSICRGAEGLWDRAALEQITYNLISNALKYGAGSPVAISLEADPHWASLRVRDRGPGISAEDRERIFERAEVLDGRTEHPGLGIGLWVARQLARALHGDITVESTVGVESVFTLKLPRGIHDASA